MLLLFITLIGLCAGSFIGALVWRMHRERNWVNDRSECAHCGHKLAPLDLVPLLSWLALRGKCRYCSKSIGMEAPLIEVTTATFFVISYVFWPAFISAAAIFEFTLWLLFLTVLLALALYDLKYMLLPNKLVAAAAVITAINVVAEVLVFGGGVRALAGAIAGSVCFGGLFWLLYVISNEKWIGGGDVKLGLVLGAWLSSATFSFLAIFTASWIGVVIALVLGLFKKVSMKSQLPFGPMLIVAAVIVQLFGRQMIDAYLALVMS